MKAQLRIEGLRVGTKNKEILKDIDLIVPERAVTAIIGMSGCGKSTLLHSLNQTLEKSRTHRAAADSLSFFSYK